MTENTGLRWCPRKDVLLKRTNIKKKKKREKRGLVISDWYFGEGKKVKKKRGMTKFRTKTMCTHNRHNNTYITTFIIDLAGVYSYLDRLFIRVICGS